MDVTFSVTAPRRTTMVSINELIKIQGLLDRGEKARDNARVCYENVAKIRRWLEAGQHSASVRQKLEQLIGRFGNTRFGSGPFR